MREKAKNLSGISLSPDAKQFLSPIYRNQFDELRNFVARLMVISVTYVVVPKIDFHGTSKNNRASSKLNISII